MKLCWVPIFLLAAGCESLAPRFETAQEQQLVFVAGATFRMGSDEADLENIATNIGLSDVRPLMSEVPSHEVRVADFYIDRYAVTNRDYVGFVAAVPRWQKENLAPDQQNGRYLEHWPDARPAAASLDHPVTFITWHSAVAYCAWRGMRLPSEAEFEWAAQSGTGPVKFPWGNTMPDDERVNWGANGIDTTTAVGSYPPNPRGLYDMSGNVWQFLADPWVGAYQEMLNDPAAFTAAARDPAIRRVVRGGSFGASAANLRVRYRDSHRPYEAREMVGFRCARSAS